MIISRNNFLTNGSYCTCSYLRISLLLQKAIILMMLLSTPEKRRATATAERRDQDNMSLSFNTRFVPQKPTAVLRVFKIMVGVKIFHLPIRVMMRDSRVKGGTP